MSKERPKIVMRGSTGLRLDALKADHIEWLQKRLTVKSVPFKNQDPIVVRAYSISDGYLWVPRYFDHLDFWPKVSKWDWVAPPLNYKFSYGMTPDPKRKQPQAIESLVNHIKTYSGGIGILPTGTGKTLLSYIVASKFNTPIGVLIYKGDMIDNWIEHAESVLGVPREDVGIVKEGRCDLGKPITIISIQTALSRELPDELYSQVGFICADECHRFASRVWGKVVSKFPARYRLAMSADPTREDGLDPVIRWNFGKVAYAVHKRPTGETPTVYLVRFPSEYNKRSYSDWEKRRIKGQMRWVMGTANAMKYYKLLLGDRGRNKWLVSQILKARCKGRRILVFSHLRNHVDILHDMFVAEWQKLSSAQTGIIETSTARLWGGLKEKERHRAMTADVVFTTHGFSREALNLPHIDTLVFGTPPGNPLQPVGRLRDKGSKDRRPLLVVDPFENGSYPFRKAMKRKNSYQDLGLTVRTLKATK